MVVENLIEIRVGTIGDHAVDHRSVGHLHRVVQLHVLLLLLLKLLLLMVQVLLVMVEQESFVQGEGRLVGDARICGRQVQGHGMKRWRQFALQPALTSRLNVHVHAGCGCGCCSGVGYGHGYSVQSSILVTLARHDEVIGRGGRVGLGVVVEVSVGLKGRDGRQRDWRYGGVGRGGVE